MSERKKKKTDLKSSILVLFVIAILLTGSTYAWFTANKTVTVSSLDVNVVAQNGLQISTNGTTWKSIISKEDITTNAYVGNTNQLPSTMEPVSTIGEVESGKMKMFYGTALPDVTTGVYKLTATQESEKAGTDGKFIVFDLFLKVDAPTNIKLSRSSNVTIKQGTEDKGLKNAARVAFCVEGNVPAGSALSAITGLSGATSQGSGGTTYFWEPNSDAHTAAAISHANDTYGITTTNGAAAVEYYGVKNDIMTGIPLSDTNNGNDTSNFAVVTPDYITKEEMQDVEIFSLQTGITKVRIYMWVEGQDVDCENAASGSDLVYNLQFTAE